MKEGKVIPVIRSSMPEFDEYVEMIRPLWESRWLSNMGKNHEELTVKLRDYLKVNELLLFVNGHMALELCLQAMGLTGEVITTPFTFASTTHAIVRNGLKPVFCDIKEDDYTMDPDKIEALITPKTSAIVPVHVYGMPCDVEKIGQIAKKHNLKVIYDAAHAFGVEVNGKGIGSYGDASMYSFHATKVYHSIEGGAIATKDPAIADRLTRLRDFGIRDEEIVDEIGPNAKMNEFCAAMGLCNLRHLDGEIEKRKAVFEHYTALLQGIPGIHLCPAQPGVRSNFAYYPVVFDGYRHTRDEVFDLLAAEHIIARKYFYPLTTSFDCYAGLPGFDPSLTPVALHAADCVLCLPMYADLAFSDVEKICFIILQP
ncbi:MAG: DegT/DnrJ/EryC1/StrS family aminotransferase [Parasporobacterium sp.]|nr:DegT/DnrJ/EryC1/StrS family aminotransferase [Parasporobacterium sp.]